MSTVGDTRSISWCHYLWLGMYTLPRLEHSIYIPLILWLLDACVSRVCVCVCVFKTFIMSLVLIFKKSTIVFFILSYFFFYFSFDFRHVDQSAEPLREILDVSLISLLRSLIRRWTRTRLPAEWNTSTHRYMLYFFLLGDENGMDEVKLVGAWATIELNPSIIRFSVKTLNLIPWANWNC
jgi:hypothetical protein